MSWRRKYFYNERSWQRYIYYTYILRRINNQLRHGYSVRTSALKMIHSSSRYIFTHNRKPALGLLIGNKFEDLGVMTEREGKLKIEMSQKEIKRKYLSYKRNNRGKFKGKLLKENYNESYF